MPSGGLTKVHFPPPNLSILEAEQALQHYYQKSNPSGVKPVKIKSKDFIPLEGVSIAIHNRNDMYA